jgi:hypothetical protein
MDNFSHTKRRQGDGEGYGSGMDGKHLLHNDIRVSTREKPEK